MRTETDFYVYAYLRPNGCPCYIGKGQGDRWLHHLVRSTNIRLSRIIAKNGGSIPHAVIRSGLTNKQAIETEIALISAIGRKDLGTGPLVNMTAGGDGKPCFVTPPETRAKISASNMGKKQSAASRAKMSATRRGKKKSPAHRAAIGAAHIGMKRTEEARAKMRAASARRWGKAEEREKIAAYHASLSSEQKKQRAQKISVATKEAMSRHGRR